MQYFVYIVKCKGGSLYTGITNNLAKRLDQHNGILKGGARYTRSHRPVALAYVEAFTTKEEAAKREYEIKQLSRAEKLTLTKTRLDPKYHN